MHLFNSIIIFDHPEVFMDKNIRNAILQKYAKVSKNKCIHPDRYRDIFLYAFFGVTESGNPV